MDVRQNLAGRLYADAQFVAKPTIDSGTAVPPFDFGQTLKNSAMETLRALRGNEQTVTAGMAGKADAQSVVQALAATEIAVETAVTVRDRVVEAYNELLRMPV